MSTQFEEIQKQVTNLPPNEKAAYVVIGMAAVLAVVWFTIAHRKFPGPPHGIQNRKQTEAIAMAEAAVHEGEKESGRD